MPDDKPTAELLEHTTRIVAAHVANNPIAAAELPSIIATVHQALAALGPEEAASRPEPAVSIKQSVKPEYIVCLDDGRKLKMLKRHLRTAYNMSPDEYRQKWGLPSDYPMVAPTYAATRSKLAKKIGLGRKPERKVKVQRKTKNPTKAKRPIKPNK